MKILVAGGGGREHALAYKLAQSPRVKEVICAPGNAGIKNAARCVDVKGEDINGLLELAQKEKVNCTVVGPEDPLTNGIVDAFQKEGLKVFGPEKQAAALEGSKVFAKHFMHKYNIPTAGYKVFDDPGEASDYIKKKGTPCVVKADGLAGGKGAIVAGDEETALKAIDSIMRERVFGDAGNKVVVEDCLEGEEASIIALTDGKTVIPMLPAQDHKRVYDWDEGPNTGGMGAYCPAPVCTSELQQKVLEEIMIPTIEGMRKEGVTYKGVLYAGLMTTSKGPKVLEYNVRFGDPEAQPLLMMLDSDLAELVEGVVEGNLEEKSIKWKDGASVCVVVASGGYPGAYTKGYPIKGLDNIPEGVEVFHAGTAEKNGNIVTSGGRVLGVTSFDRDIPSAIDRAYRGVEAISFEGMHYRKDIGKKAL